jgi:hypothetical protein
MDHRTPRAAISERPDRRTGRELLGGAPDMDLSAQQKLVLCREALRDILQGHIGEGPILDLCLSTIISTRTQVFQVLRKAL